MFTKGFELTTALTNLIICGVSIYSFYKLKNKFKLWNIFFIVIALSSLLGYIFHGIVLDEKVKDILWTILSFGFSIGINTLLIIMINEKKKLSYRKSIMSIFIMSFILFCCFLLLKLNNIDFFIYYVGYCGIGMVSMVLFYLNMLIKNKKSKYLYYYISALLINVIGGLLLINDNINILYMDHNGIYHLFLVITIYLFYKGNRAK